MLPRGVGPLSTFDQTISKLQTSLTLTRYSSKVDLKHSQVDDSTCNIFAFTILPLLRNGVFVFDPLYLWDKNNVSYRFSSDTSFSLEKICRSHFNWITPDEFPFLHGSKRQSHYRILIFPVHRDKHWSTLILYQYDDALYTLHHYDSANLNSHATAVKELVDVLEKRSLLSPYVPSRYPQYIIKHESDFPIQDRDMYRCGYYMIALMEIISKRAAIGIFNPPSTVEINEWFTSNSENTVKGMIRQYIVTLQDLAEFHRNLESNRPAVNRGVNRQLLPGISNEDISQMYKYQSFIIPPLSIISYFVRRCLTSNLLDSSVLFYENPSDIVYASNTQTALSILSDLTLVYSEYGKLYIIRYPGNTFSLPNAIDISFSNPSDSHLNAIIYFTQFGFVPLDPLDNFKNLSTSHRSRILSSTILIDISHFNNRNVCSDENDESVFSFYSEYPPDIPIVHAFKTTKYPIHKIMYYAIDTPINTAKITNMSALSDDIEDPVVFPTHIRSTLCMRSESWRRYWLTRVQDSWARDSEFVIEQFVNSDSRFLSPLIPRLIGNHPFPILCPFTFTNAAGNQHVSISAQSLYIMMRLIKRYSEDTFKNSILYRLFKNNNGRNWPLYCSISSLVRHPVYVLPEKFDQVTLSFIKSKNSFIYSEMFGEPTKSQFTLPTENMSSDDRERYAKLLIEFGI